MSDPIYKGIQYSVKLGNKKSFHVRRERTMPTNYFHELLDVSVPGIGITNSNPSKNNYVVAYNSDLNKFTFVDPDDVLVAAASTTGTQPGLPGTFVDQMDNQIDLDAGGF